MLSVIRPALVVLLLLSAITGGIYPMLVTGIAHAAFPTEANGSLVVENGKPVTTPSETFVATPEFGFSV